MENPLEKSKNIIYNVISCYEFDKESKGVVKVINNTTKVAIIGCGFVGASTAFALAMKGTVSKLVLIDVNRDKAEGEAMDINHGLTYLNQMDIYAGDYSDVKDCDVIIVTAGMNRKPGETRLDLAKKNSKVAKEIAQNIMKYYNGGVILVVSNPVDIMTYMIQKESGLPASKVIGTGTILDSSRLRYILSQQMEVDVRSIHGYIVGEHGDSQIPVWSTVNVAGIPCDEFCNNHGVQLDKDAIMEDVKTAGAQVIQKKGTTHYAISAAVCRLVEALIKNQNTVLPVSSVVTGKYGVESAAFSLPCIINSTGITRILEVNYSENERALLEESAAKLRKVLDEVAN